MCPFFNSFPYLGRISSVFTIDKPNTSLKLFNHSTIDQLMDISVRYDKAFSTDRPTYADMYIVIIILYQSVPGDG